jgi:UDPglucose 6-dehydrogenase
VGTCSQILKDNLEPTQPIGYFPENLQLGKAIERFMNPQLPVIGSNDPNFLIKIKVFLNVFNNKFSLVNLETAEMLKHSLNAFNALTISFGNEIGELSEKLGANALEVCQLLKLEPRVGEHCMIKPGLAFAGGTLARDVQSLRSLGINNSISTPLLDGIWKRNQIQNQQLLKKIDKFFGKRNDLTITILGLTYKAGTDTLRRSASIELVREIQYKYQHIRLHDPKINSINFDEFGLKEDTVILTQNITEACHNSDAIILMTPWAEYKAIDFKSLTRFFNGSLIIDPHNIWSTHKAPDNIYIDFFGK